MALKDIIGVAFPRRNDAVRYVQFDGTLESVQHIANLTKLAVEISIRPNRNFCAGDTMRISNLRLADGLGLPQPVERHDYVVVDRGGNVKVLSAEAYALNYSKDGS